MKIYLPGYICLSQGGTVLEKCMMIILYIVLKVFLFLQAPVIHFLSTWKQWKQTETTSIQCHHINCLGQCFRKQLLLLTCIRDHIWYFNLFVFLGTALDFSNLKGNSGIFKPRPYFWHEIRLSTHREQFGESRRHSEAIQITCDRRISI